MSDHQGKGPLSGVKVIDFSTLLPGPYATTMLVDLGAEVTRIESPKHPDFIRALPPYINGQSVTHLGLNRGKRSVAIDLKRPEGVKLARELIACADILVEQFRPGVMARLGLDYESLSERSPQIIYCSITGYGQSGPLAQRAGHDINYLALSGVSSYSGRFGEGPRLAGTQVADIAGGSQPAVIAILAALYERMRSGRGRWLDISMSDGTLALNALTASAAAHHQESPTLGGEVLNSGTLYDYYSTSDGRFLAVGSLEPKFAARFFEVIGHPEWLSEALTPPATQRALKSKVQALISERSLDEWRERFESVDCCVEPVLTLCEALNHPHVQARGLVKSAKSEDGTEVAYIVTPVSLSFSHNHDQDQERPMSLGQRLGSDCDEVLSELGLSASEIDRLRTIGVIR